MNWRTFIHTDSAILAGKPVIVGTRLSVELLLDRLANGWTEQMIFESYPTLPKESLQAIYAFMLDTIRDDVFSDPFTLASGFMKQVDYKWLADENFPLPAFRVLSNAGWNINHIGIEHGGSPDTLVMQISISEGRILLTFDGDHGTLVFKDGFRPLGIVYFR